MKNRTLTMGIAAALVVLLVYVFVYEGFWVWVVENTVVPSNKMLIVIAKTGREMPPGQIIAEPGQKGVLLEPLGPGRHFVNPFLYERQLKDQVVVSGGEVGVPESGRNRARGAAGGWRRAACRGCRHGAFGQARANATRRSR